MGQCRSASGESFEGATFTEMGMHGSLARLASRARLSVLSQRGVALSSQPVRGFVASTSHADGLSLTESRESLLANKQPIWIGWARNYAAEATAGQDEAPQGNVHVLEFGTHKTVTAKRFAVGTSGVHPDEDHVDPDGEEYKAKAKEILQEVGEKIEETMEESQIKKLQEKLVATEGIGEVVQDLYNQKEEHKTELELPVSKSEAHGSS